MTNSIDLPCDGCGQISSPAHIAERLLRLEWSTRYRPIHIHTLLMCATSQKEERDFLYSPRCELGGECGRVLEVAGISPTGKTLDTVQAEFQRSGFFLTPILECVVDANSFEDGARLISLLDQRLPAMARRIRQSLRPKRVVPISVALGPIVEKIAVLELGCTVVLDGGNPFALDGADAGSATDRLRQALSMHVV